MDSSEKGEDTCVTGQPCSRLIGARAREGRGGEERERRGAVRSNGACEERGQGTDSAVVGRACCNSGGALDAKREHHRVNLSFGS